MSGLDIQPILDAALSAVDACRLDAPGRYRRYAHAPPGTPRSELDVYGVADAANILYTLGVFPRHLAERAQWIHVLQQLQDPESGLYGDDTHHPIHTTAHCIAALELFDAQPLHAPHALMDHTVPDKMIQYLETLDWVSAPWQSSHQGAGLYAILSLTEHVGKQWQDGYFQWLDAETDESTGILRRNCVAPLEMDGQWTLFPHLASQFHYLFTYTHANRPHPYPWRMIDTAIDIMELNWELFAVHLGYMELDWIYCLHRCKRLTAHRHEEVDQVLRHFTGRFVQFLRTKANAGSFNDLHMVLGSICALAELQQALPGLLRSRRPLRQVLDRRPFV